MDRKKKLKFKKFTQKKERENSRSDELQVATEPKRFAHGSDSTEPTEKKKENWKLRAETNNSDELQLDQQI